MVQVDEVNGFVLEVFAEHIEVVAEEKLVLGRRLRKQVAARNAQTPQGWHLYSNPSHNVFQPRWGGIFR